MIHLLTQGSGADYHVVCVMEGEGDLAEFAKEFRDAHELPNGNDQVVMPQFAAWLVREKGWRRVRFNEATYDYRHLAVVTADKMQCFGIPFRPLQETVH